MEWIWVAFAVLASAVVLNLLVTFALVRRVVDRAERDEPPSGDIGLPVGTVLPELGFLADGGSEQAYRDASEAPLALLGFFSVTCSACKADLPLFSSLARSSPGVAAVAVVAGSPDEAAALTAELVGVPTVFAPPEHHPLFADLGVSVFPSYAVVAHGRVTGEFVLLQQAERFASTSARAVSRP